MTMVSVELRYGENLIINDICFIFEIVFNYETCVAKLKRYYTYF